MKTFKWTKAVQSSVKDLALKILKLLRLFALIGKGGQCAFLFQSQNARAHASGQNFLLLKYFVVINTYVEIVRKKKDN